MGLDRGWLVIFDQRSTAEATAVRTRREVAKTPKGREATVVWA